jgi:hypothetical protein
MNVQAVQRGAPPETKDWTGNFSARPRGYRPETVLPVARGSSLADSFSLRHLRTGSGRLAGRAPSVIPSSRAGLICPLRARTFKT